MNHARFFGAWKASALLAAWLVPACAGFPFTSRTIESNLPPQAAPAPDDPDFAGTLELRWLGTGGWYMRMGELAILTEPFFTHDGFWTTALGRIESEPERVDAGMAGLAPAAAIFLGHAHHDHILDLPAVLRRDGWRDVPVYGSPTAEHILCGLFDGRPDYRFETVRADGAWRMVAEDAETRIRYRAFPVRHAPHICGWRLYDGTVDEPQSHPPVRARKFLAGQVYQFTFEFERRDGSVRRRVHFVSSGSSLPSALAEGGGDEAAADVLILCLPLWTHVAAYPEGLLARLRPRWVLASHHDSIFQTEPGPTREIPMAYVPAFRRTVDAVLASMAGDVSGRGASSGWPTGLLIPDVGEAIYIRPAARNDADGR